MLQRALADFPQSLFAIGTVVILARIAVRLRTVGLKGFKPDDYLAFVVCSPESSRTMQDMTDAHMQCLLLYTANAVIVQITYYTGGNVYVTPGQAAALSDKDVKILSFGSKLEFISWYTYPGVICQ